MHPMFVQLFLEPDADDPLASEEEPRQRASRPKRDTARKAMKAVARPQGPRTRR